MMARAPTAPSSDLTFALQLHVGRLEAMLVRAELGVFAVGLGISGYIYLSGDHLLGQRQGALCASYFVWCLAAVFLLRRGIGTGFFPMVTPVLEGTVPATMLYIDVATHGAEWALANSLGFMAAAISIALSILRLRARVPVVCGVFGAGALLAVLATKVVPALPPQAVAAGAYEPGLLYAKAVMFLLAYGVGALVAVALRRAVVAAHKEARSQDLFGKYQLGEKLASGGMGVVHRATYCPEGGFSRPVAVKLIHPHLAEDPATVESFRREAELCSRLTHPNIVQVLDFGRFGDTYFLSMEFVDGLSLAELLKRCAAAGRALPPHLVAGVLREICLGLGFAHRDACGADGQPLRIVHRDLTPSNLMLTARGQVKIADFGIAKAVGPKGYTETQTVAGKVCYMAPEQLEAHALDERCDLFALGLVAWELLTLRRLFDQPTEANVMLAILRAPIPSVTIARPGLEPWWDFFMAKALARAPADRFQSAAEMLRALEPALTSAPRPLAEELSELIAGVPEAGEALAPLTGRPAARQEERAEMETIRERKVP